MENFVPTTVGATDSLLFQDHLPLHIKYDIHVDHPTQWISSSRYVIDTDLYYGLKKYRIKSISNFAIIY